jgi:hypothetical protein
MKNVSSITRPETQTPIHDFFGLSYANYLVLPRTLLQSCSVKAQKALCTALEMIADEEAKNMPHHWPDRANIIVSLKDAGTGRFMKDEMADYQRGRRRLW